MHNLSSRVCHAAKAVLCAALVAACNSSSPVDLNSVAGVAPGALEISPSQVNFGTTGTGATVTLTNDSPKAITWTASENSNWLRLSSLSGSLSGWSDRKLTLSADRTNLAPGTYSTNVTFVSSDETYVVPVSITVASTSTSSQLTISPAQVDFGTTLTSATITLTNNGSTSFAWTASETVGWLSLGLLSGTLAGKASKSLTIQAIRSGKTAGTYTTTVTISAGTAGSVKVPVTMTVPSTSSSTSVLLAGRLVDQFDGHALSGLTVQYAGKSATTDGSGRFTIPGSPSSSLTTLTLSGSGVHKRVTFAETGDSQWQVVPSSFSMTAFNDVARDEYGSGTVRWVAAPTVYVDTRPEGFTSPELGTWVSEVKVQAAEFISKWTGAKIQPAAVIVTSSPPRDFSPATIVIHFSEDDSRYGNNSNFIGMARMSYTSAGTVASAAIWLRYLGYSGNAGKRKGILGHELGHAMGYGHMTSGTFSFMEPSLGAKTDLSSFDIQAASLLYSRAPENTSPDTDNWDSYRSLTPSGLPIEMQWICGAEEPLRRSP